MLGLDIAYLYIKFDQSSFKRSGDMIGAYLNLNGSRDLTTPGPFQGWFVIPGLGLATNNLPSKFAVSTNAHYDDIKGGTNVENGMVWAS